ncbi:2-succinyl-5-enolpyruvyl-6-hydroxy-3-cyclohexene-1-carboxylic-acid synthase [Marinilabilia rubra]|uniref:2-succinyl-5-enolpyruvyl-6-hydroxy-3-cyclohexene-1-carboxylate synthase n=1 Tax=Marinilabilia rubra TaxID=2162893 RepID=A0A2U2B506_9BACT|nr:2-succinyl-5-enolpyruvyl-6-hydroxy-3-cyclohexene-1-carboxylic-acid synthase [Marinilabilia rubra]PWD98161.1 2-succinyl-5-enolpyruvyl-6-hydroxy-3-cyclohexene-1-carboxylic-acid synthase [Marinilabilia rubra]
MSQSISDKTVVHHIIEHCYSHGVRHVIISPGSRNAPLIISFPSSKKFTCLTIVDERSAAYFALGLARETNQPVALICTSGTAALNYTPAISEAYYQQIPLVAITADRPPEYVDQADGQTIRQQGIFSNFVRYECQMPVGDLSADDVWLVDRRLNEAFRNALGSVKGPVHINVPFREPLYETIDVIELPQPSIVPVTEGLGVSEALLDDLENELDQYRKIMLLVGATAPDSYLQKLVSEMVAKGVVVITESLSNVPVEGTFENTDRLLEGFDPDNPAFTPDLLITLDFPVLSKKLKQRLRKHSPSAHWHLSNQEILIDTYQCLTRQITGDSAEILGQVVSRMKPLPSDYIRFFKDAEQNMREKHFEYIEKLAWCDLRVFEQISQKMPDNQQIHLSNSTPVRYGQLFDWEKSCTFFSNRGTSGIDGCVSTAAGAAYGGEQAVTLISGDLGFMYDSNGLWHQYLPSSFRVIVINNGGGGIFRFIPGPTKTVELEPFFESRGNHQCRGIAETFGLQYYAAGNSRELDQILEHFWSEKGEPALLEVFTPGEENGEILRDYFSYLRG